MMNLKQLLKLNAACEYKYEKWQSGSKGQEYSFFCNQKIRKEEKKGEVCWIGTSMYLWLIIYSIYDNIMNVGLVTL